MSIRNIASRLALLLVVACCLVLVAGCKTAASHEANTADVDPGPMPDGAEWTGVYYSPLYGWLHLVQEGNLITGKWLRPRKDRWGELQGNADGNLVRFDWKEYIVGLVGPRSRKQGKGYFVYSRPAGENVDDVIEGELGRDQDEMGLPPWDAVKQRNVDPDLNSIGGSGSMDVGGGDWDPGNQEAGEPEPPVAPEEDEGPEI